MLSGRLTARQHVQALAFFKCWSVADPLIRSARKKKVHALVLGADTVVSLPGPPDDIIGKADNEDHARQILNRLSGTTQEVITGLAMVDLDTRFRFIESEITTVTMRELSESEIEDYLAAGHWRGKAGAYGIQGSADAFIERLDGSYTNVVGLPLERLDRLFHQMAHVLGIDEESPSAPIVRLNPLTAEI